MPTLADAPTTSELMPFRSTKIHFLKSGILAPLLVTGIVALLLIFLPWSGDTWRDILAVYILFALFYAVHSYTGIRTQLWIYLPAMALMLFIFTPLWSMLYLLFENVLPGALSGSDNIILRFIGFFFVAFREEIVKAAPALIGLFVFLRHRASGGAEAQTGFARFFYVSNPLEGLMLGAAAGVGFTFLETMFQYVPNEIATKGDKFGEAIGLLSGLGLLIPSILGAVTGHAAYGGISSYFVGLGAMYPGKAWRMSLIGLCVASLLHDLWDTSAGSGGLVGLVGLFGTGILVVVAFVFCMLKAKQLYATERGGVSTDSFVVGAPRAAYAPPPPPPAPKPAPVSPAPVQPVAPARPAAFYLVAGARRCALVVGETVDLAGAFPEAALPAGSQAEVSAHPKDPGVVGLRNLTQATWAIEVENGATASVPPGRNVKLVEGERIVVGAMTLDVRKA